MNPSAMCMLLKSPPDPRLPFATVAYASCFELMLLSVSAPTVSKDSKKGAFIIAMAAVAVGDWLLRKV